MKSTVNGIAINYELSGAADGPAVVLHHPLATNLSCWDELTAALEEKYRVLRLDARGHGNSDAPAGAYAFETLAKDVVDLMTACGMEKASFLGLSMGGMVGQYLGLLHPERFNCLLLVSTSSRIPDEAQPVWDQRIAAAKKDGMASQVDGAMQRWVSPRALQENAALVERLRKMILATPVDGYLGWCEAIRGLNVTSRLGAIKLPTRVIVGELDPATPVAASQAIHEAIPGSDLVIVPGVSHMLHNEEPELFHSHVLPFLDTHAGK
ncbi:MAG TPA: alpha/beta fold hydrolase [Hyphomicrobiaceae bacterium]|nr:alpha/beta fold hydrolase [Hyphomicrobiaceae bacterium]